MYLMNLGKPTKVAKLNETMAIELGANLMGEVIIFSMAGGCLILEYTRQQAKETRKEEARLAQLKQFTDDIDALKQTTLQQNTEIQYLQTVVEELAKRNKQKLPPRSNPQEPKKEKINSNNTGPNSSDNNNSSIVKRAIGYYENDVKRDKLS